MNNQRDKSKSDARCKYSIAFKKKVVHEYSKGELTQVQLRAMSRPKISSPDLKSHSDQTHLLYHA
jgi:hypothetical protein